MSQERLMAGQGGGRQLKFKLEEIKNIYFRDWICEEFTDST